MPWQVTGTTVTPLTPSTNEYVAASDGDGIVLWGSHIAGPKDVGLTFGDRDTDGFRAYLGFANAPNAWMSGLNPGDIVLFSHSGSVRLGSGPATAFPQLTVTNAGNVGIGTLTPNFALEVVGEVIAIAENSPALGARNNSSFFVAVEAQNVGPGVALQANASETALNTAIGVSGFGATAVRGESQSSIGVLGITHNQQSPNVSGVGVFGRAFAGSPIGGIGVWGDSQYGTGVVASAENAGDGLAASSSLGWCGTFKTNRGSGVYVSAPAGNPGLQVASGTKSAVVATSQGSRALYSEEATAVWFTDYGFGQLKAGRAVITIDSLFAEAVNLNVPYHVFVQINDPNCEGVAVINKSAISFEVLELRKGQSNGEFSYRIVAKRKGYEESRLDHVPYADKDSNLYPVRADQEPEVSIIDRVYKGPASEDARKPSIFDDGKAPPRSS